MKCVSVLLGGVVRGRGATRHACIGVSLSARLDSTLLTARRHEATHPASASGTVTGEDTGPHPHNPTQASAFTTLHFTWLRRSSGAPSRRDFARP
eukprot:2260093-Prymnesium_polylepis.1